MMTIEVESRSLEATKDLVVVSSVVHLNDRGNITCEYLGCSGDCDCDGDSSLPNPGETE